MYFFLFAMGLGCFKGCAVHHSVTASACARYGVPREAQPVLWSLKDRKKCCLITISIDRCSWFHVDILVSRSMISPFSFYLPTPGLGVVEKIHKLYGELKVSPITILLRYMHFWDSFGISNSLNGTVGDCHISTGYNTTTTNMSFSTSQKPMLVSVLQTGIAFRY